jgi:hypothetical protein
LPQSGDVADDLVEALVVPGQDVGSSEPG